MKIDRNIQHSIDEPCLRTKPVFWRQLKMSEKMHDLANIGLENYGNDLQFSFPSFDTLLF